jgi:hypothetical protein
MTYNSRFTTTNIYSEQPPTRKITSKAIFYIALALISIAVWIQRLFVLSPTRNWLWIFGLFIFSLIFGTGSQVVSNLKKWRQSKQTILEQQETTSNYDTFQQTLPILMCLYSIMTFTLIVTLFFIAPTLTQHWLLVCVLFIIGSGGLILWEINKRRLNAKKTSSQQEIASILNISQPSYTSLMWLCKLLEVLYVAVLFVMLFNRTATDKDLSESLIAGSSVGLFLWLAYRAYRYVDW